MVFHGMNGEGGIVDIFCFSFVIFATFFVTLNKSKERLLQIR